MNGLKADCGEILKVYGDNVSAMLTCYNPSDGAYHRFSRCVLIADGEVHLDMPWKVGPVELWPGDSLTIKDGLTRKL